MQEAGTKIWNIRWTGIITAFILLILAIPQDEAPLLYQGMLLNAFFSQPEAPLFEVFQWNFCYTSWIGVAMASLGIKTIGITGAGVLLRAIHLLLCIYICFKTEKYIKNENKMLLWGLLPIFFGSYLFSKGFYNFLYAADLSVIALFITGNKLKDKLTFASFMLLAALCHPLPVILSVGLLLILKSFQKLWLVLPAALLTAMHLIHAQGQTHWEGFHLSGRVYIFMTGLSMTSAHIYEFIFSLPLTVGTYIFFYFRGGLKQSTLARIPLLFILIGMLAPVETAGGGLIPERMFWISWVISCMLLLTQIAISAYRKYIYMFLLLFTGFKMIFGMIQQFAGKKTCPDGMELTPAAPSVRLWSSENPDREEGWLLPISTFAARKQPLVKHQIDYQNHFAWYGYYPFVYRKALLVDELYRADQIDKIKQSKVHYIWTDVNIADPKVIPLKNCSESPVKLYHIER